MALQILMMLEIIEMVLEEPEWELGKELELWVPMLVPQSCTLGRASCDYFFCLLLSSHLLLRTETVSS